ncbi:MAG: imidazole glycerol phosphate synthase subunit HisH [Methanomassiliicoccales archaeon PtaU1.Bin124]|nr:MAG: imidazole glycerol phosphate synthase subunit HisH [Methanomassiliicoccales archaeon PtaU1.Bin124]
MALNITMADYGVGNLHSIKKALEICGAEVEVVTDMKRLLDAECIVLPGVGAFDKTMERLQPYRSEIVKKLNAGTPCLGICIGMQIMYESSEEGAEKGLGYLGGRVVRLSAERVPHMGWNQVQCNDKLFRGISSPYFYFAHSFHGSPKEDVTIGTTDYFGRIPTLFRKNNTYGTQFHPEKSSASGLAFLRNFVAFAEDQI